MIVVYVNSLQDTDTFKALYENLDCKLLYNPTKEEVIEELTNNPEETLLAFGHGTIDGLMNEHMNRFIIDIHMTHLLRTREVIGIWCYAGCFARNTGLKGFFTDMFISNALEAADYGFDQDNEDLIYEQNRKFAAAINELIRNEVPTENWRDILYEGCDKELDFVDFNYSELVYFSEVDDIEISESWFAESKPEKRVYFIKESVLKEHMDKLYGDNYIYIKILAMDSLSTDELESMSEFSYTLGEWECAFNNGTAPAQGEYCVRIE